MMLLRPYQIEGVEGAFQAWETHPAILGVAATGLGKTVLAAKIVERFAGRAMVIAHREELIFQLARTIERVTHAKPDIEMAELRADQSWLHGKSKVIISTIQTQTGGSRGGRMGRFNPDEFDLLVIDEAHHAVADTYRRAIAHYRRNDKLRLLGLTATPDRADEKALGKIFDAVAFNFDIRFGIEDGWLVPIVQNAVPVDGLDFSQCRETAGDLNGADLARVMEDEAPSHKIVSPTIEITRDGRKTLIFASSLAHAERICEILNRHRRGCAQWIHGGTPKDVRRQMLVEYGRREFQYLVNVGIATEGFDDPGIEVVIMGRPTKSRALYTQMVGRGTRPLPGVVDDTDHFAFADLRKTEIARSSKPSVEIVDFVGNSGRHRLIMTADILAGKYEDAVVNRVRAKAKQGEKQDTLKALDEAEKEIREERERAKAEQAERRAHLKPKAKFTKQAVDPFDAFNLQPWREDPATHGRPCTEGQINFLERQGVDVRKLTFTQAQQVIIEIKNRYAQGKCSFKQAKILKAHGYDTNVTRAQASELITQISQRKGWKQREQPADVATAPISKPTVMKVY